MPIPDADYADIKRRLAQDTLSVAVLHVRGDADALHVVSRAPFRLGNGQGVGSSLFSGSGVPPDTLGNNNDFFLRTDGGVGTCIYQKRAASWVATGA